MSSIFLCILSLEKASVADETYLLIPDRVEEGDEGDTLQVAGPALQALQSATLKHSRTK